MIMENDVANRLAIMTFMYNDKPAAGARETLKKYLQVDIIKFEQIQLQPMGSYLVTRTLKSRVAKLLTTSVKATSNSTMLETTSLFTHLIPLALRIVQLDCQRSHSHLVIICLCLETMLQYTLSAILNYIIILRRNF